MNHINLSTCVESGRVGFLRPISGFNWRTIRGAVYTSVICRNLRGPMAHEIYDHIYEFIFELNSNPGASNLFRAICTYVPFNRTFYLR